MTNHPAILEILGHAAISPAGANAGELLHAVTSKAQLPIESLDRNNGSPSLVRRLPKADQPIRNPRMRRAPVIAHHIMRASLAALGDQRIEAVQNGEFRLGIICTLMNGCVNYSNRFFSEVRNNPATASPLLFPETVYNAPASHLSAVLASKSPNYTLIGDTACFPAALHIAANWLEDDWCDGVLLAAAEEFDWLSTEALQLFHHHTPFAESAAALYVEKPSSHSPPLKKTFLRSIGGPVNYLSLNQRFNALSNARQSMLSSPKNRETSWLIRSHIGSPHHDHAEHRVWQDWTGPTHDPFTILGHPLGASGAIQCALAVQALHENLTNDVIVSSVGNNQQCVTSHFSTTS